MTKDDRLYAKFTLDFADSPKIAPLSDLAFRTLVEMTLWSRRMLTDGFVPERVASKFWQVLALAELCKNDTVRPSLIKTDDGYQIHDFTDHQTTKADIEAKKAAGRLGGLAKAGKPVAPATDPLQQKAGTTLAKTETETEKEKTPSSEVADATVRPEIISLLDLLDSEIERNGGKKPQRTKKNIDAARLLLDRDKRTVEQIAACIRWCQSDEFWRANILSMSKLRDKYEQLRLAAQRAKPAADAQSANPGRREEVRDGFRFVNGKPVLGGPGGMSSEQYRAWQDGVTANV